MKKEYKKPEIFVENFNICQNIAAGCNKTEGARQYPGGCEFIDDRYVSVYFTSTIGACKDELDHNDCQDGPNEYGGYFYS